MTVHRDKFLIIKPTRCTNFPDLFWKETLHVSDSSSVHHQEFFTVHRIRMEVSSILILLASCQQTCMPYTIAVCTVKNFWWWTEELSETLELYSKNKFEKLVHLVGFTIRKMRWRCPKALLRLWSRKWYECFHSTCPQEALQECRVSLLQTGIELRSFCGTRY